MLERGEIDYIVSRITNDKNYQQDKYFGINEFDWKFIGSNKIFRIAVDDADLLEEEYRLKGIDDIFRFTKLIETPNVQLVAVTMTGNQNFDLDFTVTRYDDHIVRDNKMIIADKSKYDVWGKDGALFINDVEYFKNILKGE